MGRYFFMSLVVILTLHITSCGDNLNSCLDKAENLAEKGKYKEAIAYLNKAIAIDSEHIPAYINRGAYKSQMGDYEGAIEDYTLVIKKKPGNVLAIVNRGKNYRRLGDYKKAIEDFDRAIPAKWYYGNGESGIILKNYIDADYTIPEIRFERGIAHFYEGDLEQAHADFHYCINNNALLTDSHYWRGTIFLKLGHQERGCTDLYKAAELGNDIASKEAELSCEKSTSPAS
ncbi:MAG: tetratricopeptide repeat protein [Prevotellaceae bacterium]|jgi:tetratricopeptide (TPR) repeat protein|nr:tetratricopeptide repeat protein [Prevotellaceae bacterium]